MKHIIWGLFFFSCLLTATEEPKALFKIGVTHSMPEHDAMPYINNMMDAIYSPLDIDYSLEYHADSRSLFLVDEGVLDADFARFPSVAKEYKNLLKVPTPIHQVKYYYFCLTPEACEVTSETSILASKSILKTRHFCKENNYQCKFINSQKISMFTLLRKNRGDVILASMFTSSSCHTNIKRLYRKEVPEISSNLHHYLHKKHEKLLPAVEKQMVYLQSIDAFDADKTALFNDVWDCNVELVDL